MPSIWDDSIFCTPLLPVASLDALTIRGEDDEPGPVANDILDPAADIEAAYEVRETAAAVTAFVGDLPPRDQQVVRRVFWDGETRAAVARDFGLSGAAITKLLTRVKALGHRALADHRYSTLLT